MVRPSDGDFVRSHIGDYMLNPKNSLENDIIRAKDTALLRLEITFYKHALEEPVTNVFNHKYMNYPKELPPNDLLYHNSINNEFNLVRNNTVQKNSSPTQISLRLR